MRKKKCLFTVGNKRNQKAINCMQIVGENRLVYPKKFKSSFSVPFSIVWLFTVLVDIILTYLIVITLNLVCLKYFEWDLFNQIIDLYCI